MKTQATDPDIQTLVARIERGDLDLQPNFQRGEVWTRAKKQRLIDSILRGWHVPPVHVVEIKNSGQEEVLDGQQRLVSIRDFMRDQFSVDGRSVPFEPEIMELDGLRYSELPELIRRRFDRFSIRVLRIYEYSSEEPAELFYRLNQLTALTSAEQRNAFFGPAREQIKDLVTKFESRGLSKDVIGFSNARMAYDDTFARVALTLEKGSLFYKITSNDLTTFYRSGDEFSPRVMRSLSQALGMLVGASYTIRNQVRYNKATLYSWLIFFARAQRSFEIRLDESHWGNFIDAFENSRLLGDADFFFPSLKPPISHTVEWLLSIYADRAASRVADVSSVVLRDVAIWVSYYHWGRTVNQRPQSKESRALLTKLVDAAQIAHDTNDLAFLLDAALEASWTELH